jgi:heptaprenylglyceryl phosphate synthase
MTCVFGICRHDHFLLGVIVPVVQQDFLVISGSRGVTDNNSCVAVSQDAFPRLVHAGNHNLLVVEAKSLVMDVVLNSHFVKIYAGRLESVKPAVQHLKVAQDDSYVLASLDLGHACVDKSVSLKSAGMLVG